MKMTVKWKKKDRGLDEIIKNLSDHYAVTVGIHQKDNQQYEGGTNANGPVSGNKNITYASIGHIHEFGIGNNPERPWLRYGLSSNMEELKKQAAFVMGEISKGDMTMKVAAGQLGVTAVGGIIDQLNSSSSPYKANSQATKDRKGSEQPLIDTGGFKSRIKHQVNKA